MEKISNPLNPSLQNDWVEAKLIDAKIVPSSFFNWQSKRKIHQVPIVPQQKFYTLVWAYHRRFNNWPPEELWEVLLEEAHAT